MDLNELQQHIQNHLELLKLNQEQLEFEYHLSVDNLNKNRSEIDKLEKQLKIISDDPDLIISIKDWLTPEQYEQYYPNIQMLFEEDMFFKDWLDWFYEELPYIKDKHLSFKGKQTGKSYSILELNGLVKVDKVNQEIYVVQGEPVVIILGSCNLFKMLSTYG